MHEYYSKWSVFTPLISYSEQVSELQYGSERCSSGGLSVKSVVMLECDKDTHHTPECVACGLLVDTILTRPAAALRTANIVFLVALPLSCWLL